MYSADNSSAFNSVFGRDQEGGSSSCGLVFIDKTNNYNYENNYMF